MKPINIEWSYTYENPTKGRLHTATKKGWLLSFDGSYASVVNQDGRLERVRICDIKVDTFQFISDGNEK